MKIIKNNAYPILRNFVKEHSGYCSDDFKEHPEIMPLFKDFMDSLQALDGKRVNISFCAELDFMNNKGTKTGRIRVIDKQVRFYEGRKTARYYNLDAGLHEGFYATIIPLEITLIK